MRTARRSCDVLERSWPDGLLGMTMSDRTYEIRVTGLVPTQELLHELGEVETAEHEYRTVLSGRFADQAALYGFIHRLRAYGLEVVEVRRVPGGEVPEQRGPGEEVPEDEEDAAHEEAAAEETHAAEAARTTKGNDR